MKNLPLGKIIKYALVALIALGCAYILRPGFDQYFDNRSEIERLQAEIEELEAERDKLQAQVQALEDEDPEHIERIAREKLRMSKPGETVFRFKKEQ